MTNTPVCVRSCSRSSTTLAGHQFSFCAGGGWTLVPSNQAGASAVARRLDLMGFRCSAMCPNSLPTSVSPSLFFPSLSSLSHTSSTLFRCFKLAFELHAARCCPACDIIPQLISCHSSKEQMLEAFSTLRVIRELSHGM